MFVRRAGALARMRTHSLQLGGRGDGLPRRAPLGSCLKPCCGALAVPRSGAEAEGP